MRYWLYDTAITLAAPIGAGYLAASSRHRKALARFYPSVPTMADPPVWVHACSVGEVGVAQPLLNALREQYPGIPFLLTVSTVTGYARALELGGHVPVAWCPFDHPISVRRFLQQANPRMMVLIETELWPNLLRHTAARNIPIAIVNGRLSERHFRRYRRGGGLVRDMMAQLTVVGAQDDTYANRFAELGLSRERIRITGNLKFDGVPAPPDQAAREALSAELGIRPGEPVIVFGSTRPGDERRAIDCWHALRQARPDLHLILAPRHIERVPDIVKLFNEPVRLRTELLNGNSKNDAKATIMDTHGELINAYGIASLAVIGGSFDQTIQGHNPIEPAAMGIPSVFGPHMRNFASAAESLVTAGAAVQIDEPIQLHTELETLLRDADRRSRMGQHGQEVVAANRGALQRTLEMLASCMPLGSPARPAG